MTEKDINEAAKQNVLKYRNDNGNVPVIEESIERFGTSNFIAGAKWAMEHMKDEKTASSVVLSCEPYSDVDWSKYRIKIPDKFESHELPPDFEYNLLETTDFSKIKTGFWKIHLSDCQCSDYLLEEYYNAEYEKSEYIDIDMEVEIVNIVPRTYTLFAIEQRSHERIQLYYSTRLNIWIFVEYGFEEGYYG